MSANKTRPEPENSVAEFLRHAEPRRQQEAQQLIKLFSTLTGEPAVMWGPSIIGFGHRLDLYPSGREVEVPLIAFSPRKAKISLYLTYDAAKYAQQLSKLGKHTTGKGCIYVNKLADIDFDQLSELAKLALADDSMGNRS